MPSSTEPPSHDAKSSRRTILLVDDDPDSRYALRLLLDGFDVVEAQSGLEAVQAAQQSRPDCVLLDVRMPGMDGFEVCRRLRESEENRSLPVILVTAHSRDTKSVVRGLEAGADEYVTKPVARAELLARIQAMLRIRELQEQLESWNRDLERRVRERTRELRQIYDTVPVGIYSLDAAGKIVAFNRHLERMLGMPSEEAIGRSVGDLFEPDYDAVYWLDVCRREGKCASETRARGAGPDPVWVLDERVATYDDEGALAGFTGYILDISREKRVRGILAEQEKQAGVGRLASEIVHEVANPVSGVSQYLEALAERLARGETPSSGELQASVEAMRNALLRTTEILRNLREVSRPQIRATRDVELLGLLQEMQVLMRHSLERQGIEMRVQGQRQVVRADASRLSQVFLNLIANARDAMPDGGSLAATVHADDGHAVVEIRDTGVGIPPDQLDRVFEFLYTTKGDAGTGYGLAISKDIVEDHGGVIRAWSDPGKGSRFTVALPKTPQA